MPSNVIAHCPFFSGGVVLLIDGPTFILKIMVGLYLCTTSNVITYLIPVTLCVNIIWRKRVPWFCGGRIWRRKSVNRSKVSHSCPGRTFGKEIATTVRRPIGGL